MISSWWCQIMSALSKTRHLLVYQKTFRQEAISYQKERGATIWIPIPTNMNSSIQLNNCVLVDTVCNLWIQPESVALTGYSWIRENVNLAINYKENFLPEELTDHCKRCFPFVEQSAGLDANRTVSLRKDLQTFKQYWGLDEKLKCSTVFNRSFFKVLDKFGHILTYITVQAFEKSWILTFRLPNQAKI